MWNRPLLARLQPLDPRRPPYAQKSLHNVRRRYSTFASLTGVLFLGTLTLVGLGSAGTPSSSLAVALAPGPDTRSSLTGEDARKQAKRAGIDLDRVIETVGHRVIPSRQGPLVSEDRLYRAQFDATGFALTLRAKPSRSELQMTTKAAATRPGRLRPRVHWSRRTLATRFQHRPAIRLTTTAVGRGGNLMPAVTTPWRSHGNEARRELAPGVEEHVTAREGRLEWGFRLADTPAGSGALTIRAKADTAGAATRLPRNAGWRYPLRAGRSVRMGSFVVRDARGHVLYRGSPTAHRRLLTLTVPERVLRGAAFPLTVAPIVRPDYPADERPLTLGDQYAPAVAFDQTNYLVVWQDYRSSGGGIYGARVSQAGEVLDPNGIRISTFYGYGPAVEYDGTNYLVVWYEYRSGSSDIYGARVTPGGNVLDPTGIPISTAADYQILPAVAFNGTNYLVVWTDHRSGTDYDVYGARVSRGGSVLDPAGIAISTVANSPYPYRPAVTSDDTDYLVVWQDFRSDASGDIYGARVSQGGSVLDPSGIEIAIAVGYNEAPAVAFDNTNYLVAWDGVGGQSYGVYATRVSQSGTVLDPNGIRIASNPGYAQAVAFNGTNYLVAWIGWNPSSTSSVYGARVSPAGVVLDPNGIAISSAADYQYDPWVASDGTNYLVVWEDNRSGTSYDIFGARVSSDGGVLDPDGIAITPLTNDQYAPALASDGTNYLVVWQDYRSGTQTDIFGARVSPAGTVVDPYGIAISTSNAYEHSPAVAFDGVNYLVVWQARRTGTQIDIVGTRMSPAGTILDPAGIAISTAAGDQQAPALAFGGTNYLVVWQDYRVNGGVYGARVSRAGVVLDPNGIHIAPSYGYAPAVAFDQTNYLVVWYEYRPGTASDIYGARVNQAGVVLDASGIAISNTTDYQTAPAVAFDGTNYFVVWQEYRPNGGGVFGARVSPAGAVLDPSGIRISQSYAYAPAVAFDQTNYLVVWETYHYDADIDGARVTPAGMVLDSSGIRISLWMGEQRSPAVVFGPTNYLVAWSDSRSGTNWDAYGARVSPTGSVIDPTGLLISDGTPDTTPPETTIDSGPSGPTNDPTPTFAFSANEIASFQCRVDAAAFAACTSPHTTAPLSDGAHTFEVRAIDTVGLVDPTPAGRSLMVDTTAPETTIDSGPSGETSDPTPTFAFSANEPASFQCRLDVGAFGACSSPHTTETLATGSHTFEVRASDGLGNVDTTPAVRSFVVAQPPPPPPPPPVRCRVPAVVGLRLGAAQRRIRRAHCRVGRVRARHGVRRRQLGRVVAQQPRPRTVLPQGGRVRLVVGRR